MRNQLSSLNLVASEPVDTATIDLTPMLDIVFIVLILFVVLVAISKVDPDSLDVGHSEQADVDVIPRAFIHVSAGGQLSFDGRQMPLDLLKLYLHPIPSRVEIVADPQTEALPLTILMAELTTLGVDGISLSLAR